MAPMETKTLAKYTNCSGAVQTQKSIHCQPMRPSRLSKSKTSNGLATTPLPKMQRDFRLRCNAAHAKIAAICSPCPPNRVSPHRPSLFRAVGVGLWRATISVRSTTTSHHGLPTSPTPTIGAGTPLHNQTLSSTTKHPFSSLVQPFATTL